MSAPDSKRSPWHRRYHFWVLLGIAGYFLWMEHRAHFITYFPLTLLAACVGIHFLMHGSHVHGAHGATEDPDPESNPETLPSKRDPAEADRHGDTR